jgi:hypothetical protein
MGAPRKALNKTKKSPSLTAEEKTCLIAKLSAIKQKRAARMKELCQTVLAAIGEMESIETDMDAEAVELHPTYEKDIDEYKLTFESCYRFIADDLEDVPPMIDVGRELFEGIEKDAAAAATETDADAAVAADAAAPAFARQLSE